MLIDLTNATLDQLVEVIFDAGAEAAACLSVRIDPARSAGQS